MGQGLDDSIRATSGRMLDVYESNNGASRLAREFALDPEHLNQQYKRALSLVRDSVVVLDPEGRVSYLNHAAEHLYGWVSVDVIDRDARATLFAGNRESFDVAWREVRKHGDWRGTATHCMKTGVERLVETHWSAVFDENCSTIESVLIVSTEVSTVNLTAANLAHEIRNPLAGIKGVADAFLQRRQLTRQEKEWMEAVRGEVMKIDACTRDLLNLSQARAFNVKRSSLNELISHVVILARHQVDDQITVEFIDTTTEPLVMALDAASIEDAVLNLVLNAIESIDGCGRVTVTLRRQNGANGEAEALVEVTDTGSGISEDIRRRIFEPLFTTKGEGTGLGLPAVRRVAAAHGGRITFNTSIDRGSTFVLVLPLPHESTKC